MISKDISLRGLEVFELVARTGSLAKAAQALGLSLPAVSQQLSNLESSVGRPLLDRGRRPMQLTTAGHALRKRTSEMLRLLRQALAEAKGLELGHVTQLRLGVIDDFDNHVTPELTTALASALRNCEFRLHTKPSHELCAMAAERLLDVAIAAAPERGIAGMLEYPLLDDPFILIVPRGLAFERAAAMEVLRDLPFLRYDRDQMIGQRIEAQLRRRHIDLPNRFELGSNPAINALVGHGTGWAVTTALSYLRSVRFHDRIDVHPLPFAPFSRRISLFSPADWIAGAAPDLAATVRRLLSGSFVIPARDRFPWLSDRIRVLDGKEAESG